MKTILLLFLTLHLISCSTLEALSKSDREKIKAVYIIDDIKKPPTMYYFGPEAASRMTSAFGGTVVIGGSKDPNQALQIHAEKNNVFIEDIVRQEVENALKNSNSFPLVDNRKNANTFVTISIDNYGFSVPSTLHSEVVPILKITCKMYDIEGKEIWQVSDSVLTIGNPSEPVPVKTMIDNPNVMSDLWRNSAKKITARIGYYWR